MGRVKSKFSWAKAIILFLSFLFIASTLGVSLSLFRDNTSDEQSNDFAPIVLSDNSYNTLKSQVSVDMLGKSILVQPVSFVVSKDTTSSIYVRAYVNFDGVANDARQKLAYESLTAATPVVGKSYKWTRFGQYYYLCDSSNQLVGLSASNAGEIFNLLDKETNIVPEDIVDDKFASGEKVSLSVTLQSVQTSKVASTNVEQAHSSFNAVEPTLANTKTQCSVYFYDANGLSLGSQTVAYGKGVTIPTPASQSGKQLIGWNTKSDYTGATLDEADLSSVYEDLVLYAEFDALTYNVTVIQPVDEVGNRIGTITPGNTTMRYGQSLTFRVIPNTNYYIYGVYIRNEQTNQVKNIGSVTEFVVNGYTSDITIWADISQEVIFLDINGGTGTQPRITFNEDKTKFVLSETEPIGPNGKEFYYYSTNPLDNEEGQNGIRIDLGVEYPLSYLEDNKVLYAIYLTPTENYQTATDYIVVPKDVISIEGNGEQNMFGVDSSDVKFVTLPRSVKKIGNSAFKNLDGLTGLSMSTVVDSIGNNAFENCVSLEQFVFGPFVNKIGSGAFKNCVSLSTLKNFENIPTTEFVGTFEGCTMLINVTLPSVATKIEGTFKNCSNLIEVVLPSGLRNIGESTFENCVSLASIEIPSTTSFLGEKAFRNCVALTEIEGLENIVAVEIPDYIFENCVSLKEINIPSNTAVIGRRAFNSCSTLERIVNLSLVKVGEVCEEAFLNCTSLKELIFNGSLNIVGSQAFARSGVSKVSLSQRLSSLGESAFENCVNLSTVQNLGIISVIAQNTFKNCSNLFSITIPATVTTIETMAFENCTSLSSLNVPASVQTIGVDALKNATGLKSITLQGDLATIYNLASTKQNWYYNTKSTEALSTKGYYTTYVSDWIVTVINGNNYITGYRGEDVNVTIPYIITDERGERTYIYGVALNSYDKIAGFENVVIEEGIQSIFILEGTNVDNKEQLSYPCFKESTTLKSITLPSTLSQMSDGAFAGCTNLTEIIGLENTKLTKFGDLFQISSTNIWGYDDVVRINDQDVKIKYAEKNFNVNGLTYSGNYQGTFEKTALKEINLPSTLQIIGPRCFAEVQTLKTIHIPASVRAIGTSAFYDMPHLESITGLESCVLDYKTTVNGTTIECGFSAAYYHVGDGSSFQNFPVFFGLDSLKSLTLPTYATIFASDFSFGQAGFLISNCMSLETIILLGDLPQEFSLASLNDDKYGINTYSWYLRSNKMSSAHEAGTYTIFPGDDDSDWVADENGMIIAYKGSNTIVTVPSSIIQNGEQVQIVGIKTFRNKILTDVTISEGISVIDANAFADMTKLKKVKIPSTITTIGDFAFENCSNLSSIVLPDKATNVGSDVFKGCSSIKIIALNNSIAIEQNLANVSSGEWFYQNGSSSISTSSMKSKGIYSKYSSLATTDDWEVKPYQNKNYITAYLGTSREIIVPAVVVKSDYTEIYEIYGLAALKKFNFTSIIVSEGIETIGLDIDLESEADYAAFTTLGLGDPTDFENGIYLPFMRYSSQVKYIENLSTLVLPESLTTVGIFGLGGVRLNGTNTLIEIKNICTMRMNAFADTQVDEIHINNDININAKKTLSKISRDAFSGSTAHTILIGYGPTLIEQGAFSGCEKLIDLSLPASVVTIEDGAFDGCSSLVELNLKNARQIGSISDCSNLSKIILGASLYSPYAVSNINGKNGSTWFYEGGSDTAVSYFDLAGIYLAEKPDLSTLWTYEQINGKWYITGYTGDSINLTVPSSLVINGTETQIAGIKSFNTKDNVDIESIIVSEGITEILEGAFSGKSKLSKITLPSTLTSIGKNAFSGTIINLLTINCSDELNLSAGALDGMGELTIINVLNAINSEYTLPTGVSWTYISYADDQSSSSSTTTLWKEGIYTTLENVATTKEWIVGYENNEYFIAGYKLECTAVGETKTVVLEIPRLVINHKTFEVYEISSIKSLYIANLTSSSTRIKLIISEGITSIGDYQSSYYRFQDILGDSYYNIYWSLKGGSSGGGSNTNTNNIVSIELPSTLQKIGTRGFYDLGSLEEIINLENTQIKTLEQNVFSMNHALTKLEFPASLKDINSSNFSSCSNLKKIILNASLNSSFDLSNTGNGIWYYNSETTRTISMQKAGIYSSSPIQNIGLWVVELIGGKNYITAYLGGATELVVPYELYDEDTGNVVQIFGVRGIGKTDLTKITFEEGIEEIGIDPENPEDLTSNIFGGECPCLERILMPSTLTTIHNKALNNISADNIVITIFGSQKNAYVLSEIKNTKWYHGDKDVTIMQEIGSYTTFLVLAYMPDEDTISKIADATTAEERNNAATDAGYSSVDNAWLVIPIEDDESDWYVYGYLGTQSEIVVPRYVMDYTNKNYPILRELDTFYTIVKDGLYQDITKITLEEGYVQFGAGVDDVLPAVIGGGMNSVKEIILPSTITKIGMGAFAGLVSLEKVNLEDTKLTTIAPYAFTDVINLKKVKLPETVKKIDTFAFYGAGLVELELNEGLISIAELALCGLSDLKVLTISTTITSISKSALISDLFGEAITLSSLEKIIIKKDLSIPLSVNEITGNVYYKNGSQIALSNISEAGTYLSYICGTTDDWKYETFDGKNYITGYVGKKVVVDVPTYIWDRKTGGTIEIYGVKTLNNSKIRKLTIREGIKAVGNGAINIINGSSNNTLTYISLPMSLVENDSNILNGCNALESINLFGDLQTALETSDIKQATWHSHSLWLKNCYWEGNFEDYEDDTHTIVTAGGYSTYSIGQNIVQVKTAQGGYGADLWLGQNGDNVDAFVPAFGIYNPTRMITEMIGEENAHLLIKVVPMESVITLRGYAGTSSETGFPSKSYSSEIYFNSMIFAEGITRIGDKGNNNNGFGSYAGLVAIGSIVNSVTKVGSEDKINLLSFDGSFESSLPSTISTGGGTLSLSTDAYAGSKALSYVAAGNSKAAITAQLEKGVYVFEAMVKSSVAGSPLQVQLTSGSSFNTYDSEVCSNGTVYQYVFVKFEVQSNTETKLNLIQSAIYDCMSLYRVDRGLPTTLTTLGANAFAMNSYLSSINLSQTAIEEIEMFALGYTFTNSGAVDYEVEVDWSFDVWTNTLTYDGQNISMVESSEDMFWGGGFTYNAKTNRLTTPDGKTYNQRHFVQNGKVFKDVLVAVPRTLTTLGHMSLNTGATRYVGLEKSSLKSMEVGAFGGKLIEFGISGGGIVDASMFGENLVELNLPETFEDITKGSSSDIAIGPIAAFGIFGIGDSALNLTYPSNFEGYAFTLNFGLQNINVAQGNSVFSSKDGVLFNSNQSKLIAYPSGRTGSYSIPETVTTVGEASFMAASVSTITIPSNLVKIEDYAFCGTICPILVALESEGDGIDELINSSTISDFVGLENSNVETIGRGAFAFLTKASTLMLPSSLKKMGENGDVALSPIAYSNFNYIVLSSQLNTTITLRYNMEDDDDKWLYNLSSEVYEMQPAGIYSKGAFEPVWKVEEFDGNWWIVAYLGTSTSLTVPNVVLNDAGEIVKVYGVKSINYQNATQLTISDGIKEIGYPTDTTNILGSTSNSKLSSITIMGKVENMTENSLLGINGLTCLTIDKDLNSANSFAPTGRTTWYYYSNGTSETVSEYEKAGIYTSSELQREKEEWVVDSDGYIIAYQGTKTELVVPSHLLKQYSDEVIIVKGIKSFSNIRENDYFWDSNNKRFNYSDTLCNVTSVTVSEGIKTIENQSFSVFRYLSNVVEINLSSTITYIGENAFRACEILEDIRIPSSVNTIEVSALPMDKNLTTVTLDGSLKNPFVIPESYGTWFYNSEQTPVDEMFVSGTYKKATYNIKYVGNGGTLSSGDSSYIKSNNLQGKSITLDQNQFINSANAQFLGWSTDPKGLYVEYLESDSFVLDNSTRVPSSDYTITFYAVWKRDIKVLTLDPNWENSSDPNKGYLATQFGNTSNISSEIIIDLSKEVILTGSFRLSAIGYNTRLISLMNGSIGIELYSNTSNKLELKQNGNTVLTSTNAVLANVGYSYFIYKSYDTIKIKVLNGDGTIFFEQSATSSSMTGTTANYVLGYNNNSISVAYGSAMVFESTILKLSYLPDEANPNHMLKIAENGSQSLSAISGSTSISSTTLVVYKMIPTSLGSTLPTEIVPSKFGYQFGGFYYTRGENDQDSSLLYDAVGSPALLEGVDSYSFDTDVTAQAYWIAKPITITYDANGGTGSAKEEIDFDEEFSTPGVNDGFSRQGYTQIGWNVEGWGDFDLGTRYKFNYIKSDWDYSASSYEITFKAIWKANTYSVTYNPNGGNGTAYTIEVVYDSEFVLLDVTDSHINFTMKGHSFDRWRGSNASEWKGWVGKPWQWTYPQDVILYAQWTPNTYHVTYNSNGGTGNDYEFDIVYGETFVLLDPTDNKLNYSRDDHVFGYWSMNQDGSDTSWKGWIGREWSWGYDYDVTFYAQWNRNYHIIYHANGGSGATMSETIVANGQHCVISQNTYTKTGYKFSHWAELYPDGTYRNNGWTGWSGTWQWANGEYSISDYKLNFYAIWTPNTYTVTFNPNGGSVSPTTKTVTYDSAYGTLPTPTKTGFTFGGWAGKNLFNKSATAYSTGHYISGNGSTTSYAAYNIYQISVPAGATITIKNSGQSSAPGYAFYTTYGAYISGANYGNKATVTTTVPSNATYIRVSVNLGEEYRKDIDYFQIEIGSSATSYEAYGLITSSTVVKTPNNHILTAIWTPTNYSLAIDEDNKTSSTLTTKNITYGSTYGSFASPTKTGYTLNGWRVGRRLINETTFNGSSTYINLGRTYMYTDKITVMARAYMDDWTKYANGMRIISCTENGGWNLEPSGNYIQFVVYDSGASGYKAAKSKIAFADMGSGWHTFMATFDGSYARLYIDGRLVGTSDKFSSGKIGYNASNSILVGAEVGSSNTAVGSYFNGKISYVSIINSVSNTAASTNYPAYNTVAVACWTPITYTVSYNGNGNTSGSTASSSHTYDEAKALTANGFAKTGYTFAGWATTTTGSKAYDDKQSVSNLTSTANGTYNLYAKWTANTYTVTFNPNNKGGIISTQTSNGTYSGNNMTLTYTASSHEYRLVNSSLSDPFATIGQTVYLTAGTTYLMHAEVYNDSGSVISSSSGSIQIFYGISQGYSEGNSKHFYANNTYQTFTVSTTGTYNIRIDNDCGQTVRVRNFWIYANFTYQKTVTYDSTYETLPTLTRSGYTFDGWYTATTGGTKVTSSTSVGITSNQTLYGRWLNSMTITVASSSFYSNVKYSTSTGKSGSISNGGSATITGLYAGATVTITATVNGYTTSETSTQYITKYYGFKVNGGTATENLSTSSQSKSKTITISDELNGTIAVTSSTRTIRKNKPELCCVDGESEIAMADGSTKTIKNIKVGDKVLSYNIDKKALETASVEVISVVQRSEIVHIKFADGTMLKITPDHPMFSERGWIVNDYESGLITYPDVGIQKEPIDVGDMLLSLSLMFDKEVVDIQLVEGLITCYTLKVSQNSNYFAQNVLVHNAVVDPCLNPCAFGVCCVDGETDITMADGTTKKAKDISFGDKVLSFNEDTNSYETTTIEFVSTPIRYEILEITFDDGSTLKITNDHPMLTKRGWTAYNLEQAQKMYASLNLSSEALHEGDEIVSLNGTKTITSIKLIEFDDAEIVYTFGLANNQAFIANGNIVASVPKND